MFKVLILLCLLIGSAHAQLGDVLMTKKKTFVESMPKDVVDAYEQNIKDLKALGIEKKALKIGDKIPNFEITLGTKKVSISKIYEVGPLVLKFYRGGWCPYCVAELKEYERLNSEFKKAGSQILAIAPDTNEMIKKTKSKNGLSFDIVRDQDHKIAKQFGLVYDLDSKVAKHMKETGIDLAQYQGDDKADLSIPATYVVGIDGRITFSFVDADYRVRAEPSVVLEAVKKMKERGY